MNKRQTSRFWSLLFLRFGLAIWLLLIASALLSDAIAAPEDVAVHRVQAGDTLPRLCWQYKVRRENIEAANPGVADPLLVGKRLLIPLGPTTLNPEAGAASENHPPARQEARQEKVGAAWADAFVAPAAPVSPATSTAWADEPAAIPRARAATVRPASSVDVRPAVAVTVARPIPVAPRIEMAAVSRPTATTILPPQPPAIAQEDEVPEPARFRPLRRSAIQPARSAAEMPPAPSVSVPTSASSDSAGPVLQRANGPDFLGESRRLAARRLRYNGRWTPPGERSAWVMDCSNTSRYLYQAVAGLDIGRTASDQYYFLRQKGRAWDVPMGWDHKPKLGYLRDHLRVGDLLFWENTYKPVRKPDITHVMVFLGEDAQGRWQMAGSQTSQGVNIYHFDAQAPKGGYSSWFGLVHHEGRFVAYGRPLGEGKL